MLTNEVWAAEMALKQTELSFQAQLLKNQAEMIKVEMLLGLQKPRFYDVNKPRFYGDPVLEGRGKPAPTKCNSCGSQDFVLHQARHICSYCRQSTGQQHTDFNWSGEI